MIHDTCILIEKCITIFKNMVNILLLLCDSKLKSYVLKLLT